MMRKVDLIGQSAETMWPIGVQLLYRRPSCWQLLWTGQQQQQQTNRYRRHQATSCISSVKSSDIAVTCRSTTCM